MPTVAKVMSVPKAMFVTTAMASVSNSTFACPFARRVWAREPVLLPTSDVSSSPMTTTSSVQRNAPLHAPVLMQTTNAKSNLTSDGSAYRVLALANAIDVMV